MTDLEAARAQVVALVSAMKRADPQWCECHGETQIDDESWDEVLAAGEDYIEAFTAGKEGKHD